MVHLSFAGHTWLPLPEGALYWPARRALLVADLHFEKASFFARFGQLLPPYDSLATLEALARVAAYTGALEVWCLGDSFHDSAGIDRLSGQARRQLQDLTSTLDWTWITGNHDGGVANGCGGRVVHEIEVDGVLLRHEAVAAEPRPELSGHFHPRFNISRRGRRISRRCFVVSAQKLILPAFGAFTGGLDAADPAILEAAGRPATALVATTTKLLRFPLAA